MTYEEEFQKWFREDFLPKSGVRPAAMGDHAEWFAEEAWAEQKSRYDKTLPALDEAAKTPYGVCVSRHITSTDYLITSDWVRTVCEVPTDGSRQRVYLEWCDTLGHEDGKRVVRSIEEVVLGYLKSLESK